MPHRKGHEGDSNLRQTCSATCLAINQRESGPRRTKSESVILSDKRQGVITDLGNSTSTNRTKRRRPNIKRPDKRPRVQTGRRGRRNRKFPQDKDEEKFVETFSRLGVSNNEEEDVLTFGVSRRQGRTCQRLREDIVVQQWRTRQNHRDRVLQQKRGSNTERDTSMRDGLNEIERLHDNEIGEEEIDSLIKKFGGLRISEIPSEKAKQKGDKRKLPSLFYVHDDPTEAKRVRLH